MMMKKSKKHKKKAGSKRELVIQIRLFDADGKIWDEQDPLGIAVPKFNKFIKEKGIKI